MAVSKARIELVTAYITALELSSVRVMSRPAEPAQAWLETDAAPRAEAAGTTGRATFDTVWFLKSGHAELVTSQVLDALDAAPDTPIALPPGEVRDAVVNQCGILGAEWRSTSEIAATAGQAVDEVERHIASLNASGGLQPLNAKYKAYRLAMQRTGEATISYSAYLHSFKLRMIGTVARNVASGGGKFEGLSGIAPALIADMNRSILPRLAPV